MELVRIGLDFPAASVGIERKRPGALPARRTRALRGASSDRSRGQSEATPWERVTSEIGRTIHNPARDPNQPSHGGLLAA